MTKLTSHKYIETFGQVSYPPSKATIFIRNWFLNDNTEVGYKRKLYLSYKFL